MQKSHVKLFIPGPIEVSKTYRAMCEPMIGHRSGDFKALYAEIQPKLQTLFGTTRPVFSPPRRHGASWKARSVIWWEKSA